MPIPRLHCHNTALIVVDMQERILHTIHEYEALTIRCSALIQAAAILRLPILVTEQYVKGLGHTVPAIKAALPLGTPVFEKVAFSAFTAQVSAALRAQGRSNLLVCGIEAHVCVLQTVLDACANGIQTFHATDAVSSGQPDQIAPALRRMERAGSIPTGVLSALYELMGSCDHSAFRAILPLAKTVVAPMHK
ncbi:MAG: isochorismatase family protein [Phycisphaerales bacterium]|nr:isochorismatase family protein [Phycisphaerales bacterium]